MIYRDAWFDKPPLVPAVYLLWGAAIGPVLRVAGALYALVACVFAWSIAARLWSRREGYVAAAFLGFFLTFDTHSAVLPLAADLLLLVPHLAAILFAFRKQPFWSGLAAGIGFLVNAKAVFVLAACALFVWPGVISLGLGFLVPNAIALAYLAGAGALGPYIDQVWRWPSQYAGSPVVSDPVRNGIVRTVNWLGFHAAVAVAAIAWWWRSRNWKFMAWAAICYMGVVLGWRFFPRYFFLILPPLVIAASRGVTELAVKRRVYIAAVAVLLAVPLIRFAPRYISLAHWNDLALDNDSREASRIVSGVASPSATLYVWGYRPEIYVYTGLKPATRYLECQAMTGVPADRHLTQSGVVLTQGTHDAREELARSRPDFLIDGLGPFNPALAMNKYPELRSWLAQYREIARTKGAIIYSRISQPVATP
ncbi:MAG TPA: hypothetical protein VHB50_18600 [Bryobacteraceae bacterium]|nr:hypothetical protein [Bryobacteraceae bacterium]